MMFTLGIFLFINFLQLSQSFPLMQAIPFCQGKGAKARDR
jgi:hypothetical protein